MSYIRQLGFALPNDLVKALLSAAEERDESVEDCICTMLYRGLQLEEIFGPADPWEMKVEVEGEGACAREEWFEREWTVATDEEQKHV